VIALSAGSWYVASAPQRNAVSDSVSTSANPAPTQSVQSQSQPATQKHCSLFYTRKRPARTSTDCRRVAKLRKAAATKFQEMVAAARASSGVSAYSGFRSAKSQEQLFFDIKAARGQVATKEHRQRSPGYSEHHTGYAVDIGDGAVPAKPEYYI